jgi:hypothetical protein
LPPQEIAIEDVSAFLAFIKEKAGLTDQSALAQTVSFLVNQIGPTTLGSVSRQNSHIRLVARKLLTSRKEKMDEEKINAVIETLTEKMYSHGHAIGRKEAKDIGLPVEYPEDETEKLIWELYLFYEKFCSLSFNSRLAGRVYITLYNSNQTGTFSLQSKSIYFGFNLLYKVFSISDNVFQTLAASI